MLDCGQGGHRHLLQVWCGQFWLVIFLLFLLFAEKVGYFFTFQIKLCLLEIGYVRLRFCSSLVTFLSSRLIDSFLHVKQILWSRVCRRFKTATPYASASPIESLLLFGRENSLEFTSRCLIYLYHFWLVICCGDSSLITLELEAALSRQFSRFIHKGARIWKVSTNSFYYTNSADHFWPVTFQFWCSPFLNLRIILVVMLAANLFSNRTSFQSLIDLSVVLLGQLLL